MVCLTSNRAFLTIRLNPLLTVIMCVLPNIPEEKEETDV